MRRISLIAIAITIVIWLPQIPLTAEAPEYQPINSNKFIQIGADGFAFRWVDLNDFGTNGCHLYKRCAFIDLVGSPCEGEVGISLDFYDDNLMITDQGGDMIPWGNRQRHSNLEIGTNRDIEFAGFDISGAGCYPGLPTGKAHL